MFFNKESGLVAIWVGLIKNGTYTLDQVPRLRNLKEVVTEVINPTPVEVPTAPPESTAVTTENTNIGA